MAPYHVHDFLLPVLLEMSSRVRWLEHRIPPPIVAALAALAMWCVPGVAVMSASSESLRLALVVALAAAGVAINIAGFLSFHRAHTTVNPLKPGQATSLVTSGVFRVTRNPMYLGMALLLCAWAAWLWTPWALPGPIAFVVYITRFQIVPEERALATRFGAVFDAYATRVRRWL